MKCLYNHKLLVMFIFMLAFLFTSVYANSGGFMYQKILGRGFKIIQTENDIGLYHKDKLIKQESNRVQLECSGFSYNDFVSINPVNDQELYFKEKFRLQGGDSGIYRKEFQDNVYYNTLVKRACWNKFITSTITNSIRFLGNNWYQLHFPQYKSSTEYYYNIKTKYIFEITSTRLIQAEIGIHGLYILNNPYGKDGLQTLYLLKENGESIKLYEYNINLHSIRSFQIQKNNDIKFYFVESNKGNTIQRKIDSFTKTINIKTY